MFDYTRYKRLSLYRSAKAAGMGIQQVNRLLNIANNNDCILLRGILGHE
jgi:hypothetical protein